MATFVNQSKSASTFANIAKTASSFSNQSKSVSGDTSLLLESGFYMLLENGGKIILEQSNPSGTSWSNAVKN